MRDRPGLFAQSNSTRRRSSSRKMFGTPRATHRRLHRPAGIVTVGIYYHTRLHTTSTTPSTTSISRLVDILPNWDRLTSTHTHQLASQHAAHPRQAHRPKPLRSTQSTSRKCALLPIHLGDKSICLQAHMATRVRQAVAKAPIQARASLQATRKVGICKAQLAQDGEAGAMGQHLVCVSVRHSVHGVDGWKHTFQRGE